MIAAANVNTVRFLISLSTVLVCGALWVAAIVFLRVKKKRSFVHLFLVTVFFVYCYKVLDYTLFQFQSLLLLNHFVPGLMLNGVPDGESINLVPLVTLTAGDVRTSLLNILMMMPFGFGLPFIARVSMTRAVALGALFSIAIELAQLITGMLAETTFRVADINDVIFNTLGAAIGYALFSALARTPAMARVASRV
jgi:glycopeptide antibiotics resistance protein